MYGQWWAKCRFNCDAYRRSGFSSMLRSVCVVSVLLTLYYLQFNGASCVYKNHDIHTPRQANTVLSVVSWIPRVFAKGHNHWELSSPQRSTRHTRTVLSLQALTTFSPSGEKDAEYTPSIWPARVCLHSVTALHMRTRSLVVAGTHDFLPIGRERRRHHHTRMVCKSLLAKLQLRPVFLLDKLGPWESSCWTAKLSRIKIAAVGPRSSASQLRQPHSSSGGSSCNNANEVCITLALSGPGYEDINIGISDLACQAIIIILPLVLAL